MDMVAKCNKIMNRIWLTTNRILARERITLNLNDASMHVKNNDLTNWKATQLHNNSIVQTVGNNSTIADLLRQQCVFIENMLTSNQYRDNRTLRILETQVLRALRLQGRAMHITDLGNMWNAIYTLTRIVEQLKQ
jgi:hypothetical protein